MLVYSKSIPVIRVPILIIRRKIAHVHEAGALASLASLIPFRKNIVLEIFEHSTETEADATGLLFPSASASSFSVLQLN